MDRDEYSYAELKEALIEELGSSRTALGVKFYSEFVNDAKSLDSVQAYVKLKNLADSINMATSDKNDLLLFMAVSAFRASRPLSQRALMDAREIHSFRDLSKVAASFRAPDLDKSVVRSNYQSSGNNSFHRSVQCYICHRYGHRSFECRFKNNSGSELSSTVVSRVLHL